MAQLVTTDRLDVWRDLIRENFVALDITAGRPDSFAGRVETSHVGPLTVASVQSGPQDFTRTPRLARADDDAYLQVGLLTRGSAVVRQDGRAAHLAPGDFAVYETDRAFCWGLDQDWELLVFTWPRAAVPLRDTASQALTARCLSGAHGVGALVGRMLCELAGAPPELSVEGGTRLGHEVLDLVVTVATEQVRPSETERSSDVLLRHVDAYIIERLGDPQLTPPDIAAAHFISTRHLHRLFAGRGATVGQQIATLRLERARLELRHRGYDGCSITEISRRWGFPDLATFSRAFRVAYGTTPTRYRAARTDP